MDLWFEELKKRALEYPPEKVAEITWIPAEKIRESARLYASSKPASITLGLASDHFGLNPLRVEQALLCLHAVTGNMRGNTEKHLSDPARSSTVKWASAMPCCNWRINALLNSGRSNWAATALS